MTRITLQLPWKVTHVVTLDEAIARAEKALRAHRQPLEWQNKLNEQWWPHFSGSSEPFVPMTQEKLDATIAKYENFLSLARLYATLL